MLLWWASVRSHSASCSSPACDEGLSSKLIASGVERAMHAFETAIAANSKAARKAIGRFIDLSLSFRASGRIPGKVWAFASGEAFRKLWKLRFLDFQALAMRRRSIIIGVVLVP